MKDSTTYTKARKAVLKPPARVTRSEVKKSSKKIRTNKSADADPEKSDDESSQGDEIAYKAGELVAFVDKSDAEQDKRVISIGKVS